VVQQAAPPRACPGRDVNNLAMIAAARERGVAHVYYVEGCGTS
jgi:hypothetical protein